MKLLNENTLWINFNLWISQGCYICSVAEQVALGNWTCRSSSDGALLKFDDPECINMFLLTVNI